MIAIASRDNPRVRRWRDLVRDARERRRQRRAMIEGGNLVAALLQAGLTPECVVLSKAGAARPELAALAARCGRTPVMVENAVFRLIADTEAPVGIAAEIALPDAPPDAAGSTGGLFLEAVQDAGNVGAILRSAAAFGIRDAWLGPGCADAWSPKVLRAAMGAHFAMRLGEGADLASVMDVFPGKVVCTAPRGGVPIGQADLAGPLGWLFGGEGKGVSDALGARAGLRVSIPMPGDAESLNVAAAAAICFYAAASRGPAPA